ncbi:hypothetical protein CNR22_12450 [Sphingobacteriaceae bacterium]|nr:hypothetical protein CNR22_12450 [Sphingobacteriaceae bacterium]
MKARHHIFLTLLAGFTLSFFSQTSPFRENGKWGIWQPSNDGDNRIIIKPVYDTIFNFDSTAQVCLACFKTKTASANKFIKVTTTTYACNYLNKKNERLIIRNTAKDTFSVFALNKNVVKAYNDNRQYFTVTMKGKKNLVYKNFQQLTFKGYHEIGFAADKKFYQTSIINEGDIVLAGLMNEREEEIIPHRYSIIKMNTNDSLLVACSAGVRFNAEDEVFDYTGKKIIGTFRHIDMATRNFLIHKIFEPKEYYVLYNIKTKEEKTIHAEEIKFYDHDIILVHQKNDWYSYDLNTNIKTKIQP